MFPFDDVIMSLGYYISDKSLSKLTASDLNIGLIKLKGTRSPVIDKDGRVPG